MGHGVIEVSTVINRYNRENLKLLLFNHTHLSWIYATSSIAQGVRNSYAAVAEKAEKVEIRGLVTNPL